MRIPLFTIILASVACGPFTAVSRSDDGLQSVGVAQIDITPEHPIRLRGFAGRTEEASEVQQRLWAKALAIGDDPGGPVVLVAMDNCVVPPALVNELAGRLARQAGLEPDHLAVTCTHTHSAPILAGASATLYDRPFPAEHELHIDQYTAALIDKLEHVALAALRDRRPARLEWGIGQVGFARNRRTPGGPVDHDLPMLCVKDASGEVRAIYLSYACHCTTLTENRFSGDWAGYAMDAIQRQHPQAIALVSMGCGADSNPLVEGPASRLEAATQHGLAIADEVERLLEHGLMRIAHPISVRVRRFELPLANVPGREEWQRRAQQDNYVGYHARVQLDRLDRGEALRTAVPYTVGAWSFGDDLCIVFLSGEVVVDYSLRLKRELDRHRLWLNAYANDVSCYIPSERVLAEGGYEGGDAMVYHDWAASFRPGLEQRIVDGVRAAVPVAFHAQTPAGRE